MSFWAMHHENGKAVEYSAGFDDSTSQFFGVTETIKDASEQGKVPETEQLEEQEPENDNKEGGSDSFQPMLF